MDERQFLFSCFCVSVISPFFVSSEEDELLLPGRLYLLKNLVILPFILCSRNKLMSLVFPTLPTVTSTISCPCGKTKLIFLEYASFLTSSNLSATQSIGLTMGCSVLSTIN